MTSTEIIARFELQVDDSTELSTSEELDLLNEIYFRVASDRPWKILSKEKTGTITSTTTITIPTDFEYFLENYNYTDNSVSQEIGAKPAYVFINSNPIQVINFSDRKRYVGGDVCYVDFANNIIKFTRAQSASATYSFDYKSTPTALVGGGAPTSPVFPARFHTMFAYGMAAEDFSIQLYDKNRSYALENQARFNKYMIDMAYWDANLSLQ